MTDRTNPIENALPMTGSDPTAQQRQQARQYVQRTALNAADAQELLQALGLDEP